MPQMQLDDENAVDWGNEEEEYQGSSRRPHAGFNAGVGTIAGDDVEDTISLGDDDDDQRFYSLARNDPINSSYNTDQPASPPSSQSKSTASGANTAQVGRHSPEPQTQGRVPLQEGPMNQTPHKRSTARHSPQRSLPRLTHALPPKPVAASVTALTQPFPAVIAVTTITPISPRSAARDPKTGNDGTPGKLAAAADLPQDWEPRCSRKGDTYYYNRMTHESTWSLPGSKSVVPPSQDDDSKSLRQPRSVSADGGGNKAMVSIDSNTSCPQTSRDAPRAREPEIEERRRLLTPDADGLTFEDRHYRPGLTSVSLPDGVRGFDRSDISTSAGRHARSPSPRRRKPASPPASELQIRTKEPPRDQRSVQEKLAHTKPSSLKLDSYRPDYDSRRLPPPPPPPHSPSDYHGRQREHVSYVTSDEDRMQVEPAGYMQGPPLRREDVSRDHRQRSKDRDLPPARSSDVRDPSASQNYFSAQRSRSPALLPPPRERERDGKHESREHHYENVARRSEWEQARPYERSHAPKSMQDYASGRDRPIDPDVDPPRGRNLERERAREDRSERDRGVHHTRREPNTVIDADQRPQGDTTKLKRNAEDCGRKAEELALARSKRVPLPPQQASFRSARLRDPPPHLISTPSKRPEGNPRLAGVDDALPRQPRKSLGALQPPPLDLSHPPNGVNPQRFHDGYERQGRPSHIRDNTPYPGKINAIHDDALLLERRQSDRRLPEDPPRSSNIPVDLDRTGALRPRASTNDNGRRDLNYDKVKDEKPREGTDRDVLSPLDRDNTRRGRDAPRQPARLTGTNNVPIGNRRPGAADPEIGPLVTIPVRNLPPGKESYERPLDVPSSDSSRQPGPSSRSESGKNRSLHELRQPHRHDVEARGRKPYPHPLLLTEQYSNGSSHRPSSPPPLSRDLSGSVLSSVHERLSTYPSSDGRSEISFRPSQNADPPSRSRGSYRDEPITRWDSHRVIRRLSYSPVNLSPDEADGAHSRHSSGGDDPLPPRPRKSGDIDARFSSSGNSKISTLERSDFISRVEPPPLRRGGSLLDRLSLDNKDHGLPPDSLPVAGTSLRDRLVPSKRDRDEMMDSETFSGRVFEEKPQDLEGSDSKRARKRGGGGGGGGGGKRRSAGRRI